jgi:hypothetical protein
MSHHAVPNVDSRRKKDIKIHIWELVARACVKTLFFSGCVSANYYIVMNFTICSPYVVSLLTSKLANKGLSVA